MDALSGFFTLILEILSRCGPPHLHKADSGILLQLLPGHENACINVDIKQVPSIVKFKEDTCLCTDISKNILLITQAISISHAHLST